MSSYCSRSRSRSCSSRSSSKQQIEVAVVARNDCCYYTPAFVSTAGFCCTHVLHALAPKYRHVRVRNHMQAPRRALSHTYTHTCTLARAPDTHTHTHTHAHAHKQHTRTQTTHTHTFEENVFQFQVSVYDLGLAGMQVGHALCHLLTPAHRIQVRVHARAELQIVQACVSADVSNHVWGRQECVQVLFHSLILIHLHPYSSI